MRLRRMLSDEIYKRRLRIPKFGVAVVVYLLLLGLLFGSSVAVVLLWVDVRVAPAIIGLILVAFFAALIPYFANRQKPR